MKFKLITGRDDVIFEHNCNRAVEEGYRPQGGVTVAVWAGINQPLYAMMFVIGDLPEPQSI